jgi:2-oxoglutarate dehydrogenase complex dehydrogenase (E1) component-like enzyme
MHIADPERRRWIQERIEAVPFAGGYGTTEAAPPLCTRP